jgi:hypothetical protein
MDKVGYDKGLIRYTSERAMLEHMDNKKARHYIFKASSPKFFTTFLSIFSEKSTHFIGA